jgi:hypothetical protein
MANPIDIVLSSFNSTMEAIQKVVETRDTVKLGEIKSGFFAQIEAAYNATAAVHEREAALREENEGLKRRIAELESAETGKSCYALKRLHPGITICVLKEGMDASRYPQQACYTCYQRGEIHPLQSSGVKNGIERLHCDACDTTLKAGTFVAPEVPTLSGNPFRRFR